MRKIIYFLIISILLPNSIAFAAYDDMPIKTDRRVTLVKDDFENYRGYYTEGRQISPTYWEGWGTNGSRYYADVVDKEHGKSLCFETSGSNQNPYTSTSDAIKLGYSGDFVFEIEFYAKSHQAVRTIMLRGESGYYNIGRWKTDGSFLLDHTGGYYVLGYPETGKWHKYQIVYNKQKNSCKVYFDGKMLYDEVKIKDEMQNGIKGVRIKQEGIANGKCAIYYDNLAIYSGNEFCGFDELGEMKTVDNMLDDEMKFTDGIMDKMVLKINSPFAYINGERKNIDAGNAEQKVRIIEGTTYVPARFVAENLNAVIRYNPDDGSVTVNDRIYTQNTANAIERMYIFDDRAYLPLRNLAELLGKAVTYSDKGKLIFIADRSENIDTESAEYTQLVRHLTYSYPTPEQIKENFKQNVHPRIMADASQFAYLKENINSDPNLQMIARKLRTEADECLDDEYGVWNPNDNGAESCLGPIRTAQKNIMLCAAMYLITGEEKYKTRTYNEAYNLCSWPDWNYVHFLDTAEAAFAVAVAYDWLYDYWTPNERKLFAEGIKTHALDEAAKSFDGSGWSGWVKLNNNWSFVCSGGINMAAMAVFDLYPDYCAKIISDNYNALAHALPYLAPEGAWEEGTNYWAYLMRFYIPMLASSDLTFGTEFGYLDMVEGAKETAYFSPYMTGPTGEFNYHDSSAGFSDTAFHFWIAGRLNDKGLGSYRMSNIMQGMPTAYDLVWYRSEYSDLEAQMPLDKLYTENVTTATFRNSWTDKGALFAAIHGGANDVNHGHLDIGEFVVDALGERFFMALGADTYAASDDNGIAYLGSVNFYRRRAEGHNTIVINPPGKKVGTFFYDQNKAATGVVKEYVSKPRGGYLKLDMTQSNDSIADATRGIMMTDGRKEVIVRDEVQLKSKGDLWWFGHTKANVTLSDDKRSALLELNGKYMNVSIQSEDESLVFGVMDAIPLENSPNPASQNKNTGIRKLYIKAANVNSFNVSVVFTPLAFSQQPVELPACGALAEWDIPDGEIEHNYKSHLTSIAVDGEKIEEFHPLQRVYNVMLDSAGKMPVVSAECTQGGAVSIKQAEKLTDCALIELEDSDGVKQYYSIGFTMTGKPGQPDGMTECGIIAVEASQEPQAENPKEASIDNNPDTRWSAEGRQNITFELSEIKKIGAISTAWFKSEARLSYYRISVSEDKENWTIVFSGMTAEANPGYNTTYINGGINSKYIRVDGLGNSENDWNSLTEIKIYEEN